ECIADAESAPTHEHQQSAHPSAIGTAYRLAAILSVEVRRIEQLLVLLTGEIVRWSLSDRDAAEIVRWITSNPTNNLGRISVTQTPTDYFTREEYEKLLDATYLYRENRGETIGGTNSTRMRTLLMLMRWSGLRIRDALTLERTRLINDNLLLYQAKTGTPVYVPLPPQVADALRTVPDGAKPNPRYFFWSGNGLPKSAVADYQRSFRRLFKLAALEKGDGSAKRCFPHMLRDTFAVEMLLAGVPIDQVSMLLGHSSV